MRWVARDVVVQGLNRLFVGACLGLCIFVELLDVGCNVVFFFENASKFLDFAMHCVVFVL